MPTFGLVEAVLLASSFTLAPRELTAHVYDCDDGSRIVARFDPSTEEDDVFLFLPGRTVRLTRVSSSSGPQYRNGDVWLSCEQGEAKLRIGGRTTVCREDGPESVFEDAKLRGIDFRAVGNEPGWSLEIGAEETAFETNYGEDTYRFPTPEPRVEPDGRTVYHFRHNGHELVVTIERKACADDMSGKEFEATVHVVLDGKEENGCGRALH